MTTGPSPTTDASVADQLREVYELIDDLQLLEDRLRVAVDSAMTTLKGDTKTHD